MRSMHLRLVACLIVLMLAAIGSAATTVTFDSTNLLPLPYTEDGLTFENIGPPPPSEPPLAGAGFLFFSGSGGSSTYRVRASSPQPFDLITMDLESARGAWRIESSGGGSIIFDPTIVSTPTTIEFSGTPGFKNISYFDIIHDYQVDRRSLIADTVIVNFVPEPSSVVLACGLPLIAMARWRTSASRQA